MATPIDKQQLRRATLVNGVIENLDNLTLDQIRLFTSHMEQPFNPVSGTVYSSISALSLSAAGYEDPRWMTYKQAASVGAQVAKGQKATYVEIWDKEEKKYVYTALFNASQIDGLEENQSQRFDRQAAVEKSKVALAGSGITVSDSDEQRYRHTDEHRSAYAPALRKLAEQSLSKLSHGHAPHGSEAKQKQDLRVALACALMEQRTGWRFSFADWDNAERQRRNEQSKEWATILRKRPQELFTAARDAEVIASWCLQPEKRQELEQVAQKVKERREQKAMEKPVYQPATDLLPDREFAIACQKAGLLVDKPIMDGEWQRVKVDGDKSQERSGSYRAFADGHPNGWIKNFKTGETVRWVAAGQSLSPEEREQLKRDAETIRAAREQDIKAGYEKAAKTAYGLYENAAPVQSHPYLEKKQVPAYDLKTVDNKDESRSLIVPVRDVEGNLQSLQFIRDNGAKQFLSGGRTLGGMHIIDPAGELTQKPLVIAEGYATAATIHECTGNPVVVAFNANNLKSVAEALHNKYPHQEIVLAADDDHAKAINVGRTKADDAAKAVGGTVVLPPLSPEDKTKGLTDFNDLKVAHGPEPVRQALVPVLEQVQAKSKQKEQSTTQGLGMGL